jgi:hypothetical protein
VAGAENGPRGVCSGAFGLWLFGLILGVLLSALLAGLSSALAGPVVYDPVALGVGDAGELV